MFPITTPEEHPLIRGVSGGVEMYDSMAVSVPLGSFGGMHVEHVTVTGSSIQDMLYSMGGRPCIPGTYTVLRDEFEINGIWMSDTTAERIDHLPVVATIRQLRARAVLINGLGLGMAVQAALACDHITRIDVVERDPRVIHLVAPHYTRDPRVHIHQADAFTIKWPRGMEWDVVWHDIWPTICADNLPEMAKLHRKYGQRCLWQGSWCSLECRQQRISDKRMEKADGFYGHR